MSTPLASINVSTPLAWFCSAVDSLRASGWGGSVLVCSDGTDAELEQLLTMPGVSRSRGRNALEDMMTLADGRLIVGSGSTFSAWAAFLGSAPLYVEAGRNHFLPGFPRVREVPAWDQAATASLREDIAASSAFPDDLVHPAEHGRSA